MESRVRRIPVVGVMGSGSDDGGRRAVEVGQMLAAMDVHLLTGGGGGTMHAVSRAFAEIEHRSGLVIGVIPAASGDQPGRPRPGYPNPFVELVIRTHLPLSGVDGTSPRSRNHINVLTSDIIIALAGRAGTSSEVKLAMHYGVPVIAYVDDRSAIPDLPSAVPVISDLPELKARVGAAIASHPTRAPGIE